MKSEIKTKTSEETADVIDEITPDQYRKHVYDWLIQHGMYTCAVKIPK